MKRLEHPWKRWQLLVLGLLFICYNCLVPTHYRHWIAGHLALAFSQFVPHAKPQPELVEALDAWDMKQRREYDQAGLWKLRLNQSLDAQIPGLQIEQMQTLIGQANLAQVIMQPYSPGASIIWIRTSQPCQVGSSVTVGDALIGFVDLAYEKTARVRLIFDPMCQVSVRTLRPQHPLQSLQRDLGFWLSQDCLVLENSWKKIKDQLEAIKRQLDEETSGWTCCSKGLLVGSELDAFGHYQTLKGVGFNYLWPDAYGSQQQMGSTPLVAVGDELVTSGLDGRFPGGLRVAIVTSVQPQDPANTLYEIRAKSVIPNPYDLRWVWILPALSDHVLNDGQK